jgi:hypothetical protein
VTGAAGDVTIMANGQDLHVRPGAAAASLTAKAAGWYLLAVSVPEPAGPLTLQLQRPGAAAPGPMADMWQLGYGRYAPGLGAAQAMAPTAAPGLVVYYRWAYRPARCSAVQCSASCRPHAAGAATPTPAAPAAMPRSALSAAEQAGAAKAAGAQPAGASALPIPADFQFTTVLPALELGPGELRGALFPPERGALQVGCSCCGGWGC